jgi:hypothetical protein
VVELARKGRSCHPEEIPEKVESPEASSAVDILQKQQHHSMLLVRVILLVIELLSVLITLL